MVDKSRLDSDLVKKLDRLEWMLEQPALFIAEHFALLRKEIDLDAERLIDAFEEKESLDSAQKIAEINTARTKFIAFLDKIETSLSVKLHESSVTSSTFESFGKLKKQVEEFSSSSEFKNLNEMEEVYLQLALDLIEASFELEKRLLDNQTLAFVPNENVNTIGNMIYLSEDFLNRDELSCLKQRFVNPNRHIHETIQASLNASLAVGVSRPFVLTKNFLLISEIMIELNSLESSTGCVIYLESSSKISPNIGDDSSFYRGFKIYSFQVLWIVFNISIDAVFLPNISLDVFDSDLFLCNMNGNRLRRFEIDDRIVQSIQELDLCRNQIETLDVEQLAKATKLRRLKLASAFLPDIRFSLDFLASFSDLIELQLTLQDAPIDFEIFQNLKSIQILKLHSATSLNSSIERLSLTKEHFKQLSTLKKLCELCLSHFKIESLQKEMLSEFANLEYLYLNNNDMAEIEDGALERCFGDQKSYVDFSNNSLRSISAHVFTGLSKSENLDLSFNRIEQLSPGVFVQLESLENFQFKNNSIRLIARGAFDGLKQLENLNLENNLIETIETGSFEGTPKLVYLWMGNNKLKSIENHVLNPSSENAILNESSIKRKSLFCELRSLEHLSLKSNKLQRVDLNCFCNLELLKYLDLSDNQIGELNDEIQPGVLSHLTDIDLSNNELTRISRHAFSESTKLESIKLLDNKLETFDQDFFEPFACLRYVNLRNNNLSIDITTKTFSKCPLINEINLLGNKNVRLENGALSQLKSLICIRMELGGENSQSAQRFFKLEENDTIFGRLTSLSLVKSSVESLDEFKVLNRFSNLLELDLRGNRITSLSRDSLSAMPQLHLLNLAENLFEVLEDPTLFQNLRDLDNLDLSGNKLKHIHRHLFKGLCKLQTLDLTNNPSLLNLDSGLFRGLFSLKKLNLAGNNIAFFDLSSLFRSCRVLESLDLSNNRLDHESINEASMSGITAQNLKELMLANNRLDRMEFVRNLYRLERLDLSRNKIESVTSNGVNILYQLVKLEHVNLSNNQINSLEIKAIFSHLKYQLEFLDLSNNPFNSNKSSQSTENCVSLIENSSNLYLI